ncbi:MAG: gliding motility-associated C-terminal domain-containing protein, partial [Saprospirales bacterium]
IDECGDGRGYIADDSVQVYGDFSMDSIRVRIVDDPAGADGSLVAPDPSNGITVGSGTAELLTTGIMDFVDWESWLRQVEYVDSSDPPASGLRRIAVIGYFNEGERTDTAWSEIEVLVPEISAGLGGEFEECPNGESVNLFTYLTGADEGGHWEPNFPDGEIELLPQYSGTYYYIVEDAECGSDTAQVELFVWPGPDVEITGGGIYCEGSTINLELQGDVGGTTSLLWSTGSTADRIEITEPGTYWLRMVYEEDCIWTDTVLVAFEDRTVVQEEIGLCPDEVLDWQGQQIIEEGQYETILSGSGGDCDTLFQLTVVASEYVNANLSREICPGESFEINGTVFSEPGEFELVLPATDGCDTLLSIVVDWSEDIERRETLRICPGESIEVEGEMLSEAGEYEFTISSVLGCDTILLVRLEHEFVPEAAIIGPDRVCEGEEILLRASPQEQLQQIFWSIGDISSEIRISEGGLYSFEAITYDDCGVYAEKWIEDCPSRQVYIPNAFSPNNDGVNDEWTIYTAAEAVEFEVQIYNRWGAKVFEQKGPSISWDGSYRNEILPGGVYVFQLRLIFSDGEIVDRIGEVMLVR